MKTTKLVFGILSIVFSVQVFLQSFAAGVVDAIEAVGGTGGSAGLFVASLMLAGGIVDIAALNSKGGAIACVLLFCIAAIIGVTMYGVFTDLQIWSWYCILVAAINLISIATQFRDQ